MSQLYIIKGICIIYNLFLFSSSFSVMYLTLYLILLCTVSECCSIKFLKVLIQFNATPQSYLEHIKNHAFQTILLLLLHIL